ncbi:hypothetical protein ACVIGA_008995 [Bradyrhizobium sp. USDA 3240]
MSGLQSRVSAQSICNPAHSDQRIRSSLEAPGPPVSYDDATAQFDRGSDTPHSPSSSESFLARLGTFERAVHLSIGDTQGQRRGTCQHQHQYGGAKFATPRGGVNRAARSGRSKGIGGDRCPTWATEVVQRKTVANDRIDRGRLYKIAHRQKKIVGGEQWALGTIDEPEPLELLGAFPRWGVPGAVPVFAPQPRPGPFT